MPKTPGKGRLRGDSTYLEALEKTYAARSKFFYREIQKQKLKELFDELSRLDSSTLEWTFETFGITEEAGNKVKSARIPLHFVFCHPKVITGGKNLLRYYRNLAALSQKGLSQLLSLSRGDRANESCRITNRLISSVVESMDSLSLEQAKEVMLAEIGTEIQGGWVNLVGKGASRQVEELLKRHALENRFAAENDIKRTRKRSGNRFISQLSISLVNGWRIVFGAEPDVAVFDDRGKLQAVVEIKGSMDKAGAQTRYGEAKKSFGKALSINPKCETIYLASCFTEAVQEQIANDGQVRRTFNLTEILADGSARKQFLDEIFRFIIRF